MVRRVESGSIHPITDEGRRVAETHEAARIQGAAGRFVAIRLADGRGEGDPLDIYDTFRDLARHIDDDAHAPLCINPVQMPPAEGTHWLGLQRRLAAQGWKLTDPDTPRPTPNLAPAPPRQQDRRGLMRVAGGLVLPSRFADVVRPHLVPLNRKERRARGNR